MPAFDYKAKTDQGETVAGSLVAANVEQLESILEQRNLLLIEAKERDILDLLFGRNNSFSSQKTGYAP